jgi:hypothetical protein
MDDSFDDELDDFSAPRKWLDKKEFVRIDPVTGLPQLIRMEPVVLEGEFLTPNVTVYIDDSTKMVMDREAAEIFIESMNCTPLEITAHWKHRTNN